MPASTPPRNVTYVKTSLVSLDAAASFSFTLLKSGSMSAKSIFLVGGLEADGVIDVFLLSEIVLDINEFTTWLVMLMLSIGEVCFSVLEVMVVKEGLAVCVTIVASVTDTEVVSVVDLRNGPGWLSAVAMVEFSSTDIVLVFAVDTFEIEGVVLMAVTAVRRIFGPTEGVAVEYSSELKIVFGDSFIP